MTFTSEQQQAIDNIYAAVVEALRATPDFDGYLRRLNATGLKLREASLELVLSASSGDPKYQPSDADFLRSLRIDPS